MIVPFENAERLLRKTIDGVLRQTLDFRGNIQLVLLDNASDDGSAAICRAYQEQYPENVDYIRLDERESDAAVKNRGLSRAVGTYLNFMAPGEFWDKNAFSRALRCFKEHSDIRVIAGVMQNPNGAIPPWDGYLLENRRTRIISLSKREDGLRMHLESMLLHRDVIGQTRFREVPAYGGDIVFLTQLLQRDERYFLSRDIVYKGRDTQIGQDLLGFARSGESENDSRLCALIETLRALPAQRETEPHMQALQLQIMKWCAAAEAEGLATEEAHQRFRRAMEKLLQGIPEERICAAGVLYREDKILFLSLRNGRDISGELKMQNGTVVYRGMELFAIPGSNVFHITNFDFIDGRLQIMGKLALPLADGDYGVEAVVNDAQRFPVNFFEVSFSNQRRFAGQVFYRMRGFKVSLPLAGEERIGFCLRFDGQEIPFDLTYDFTSVIPEGLDSAYAVKSGYLMSKTGKQTITVQPASHRRFFGKELRVWAEMFRRRKARTLLWRILIYFAAGIRNWFPRKLWVFVDYFNHAEDNAETLYQYAVRQKTPGVKMYFVVEKDTPDYERIRQYGKVVAYDTLRYRLLIALCDKIITSQTFFSYRNTFYYRTPLLKDLFRFRYVYLQHGIIKDNHSNTLAHYKTDLSMLITSAQKEYDSLMAEDYQLTPEIVKLTGLARHDKLSREKKPGANKILIAPTWRKYPEGDWDESIQGYRYWPGFVNSAFYRFFNGLVTNPRVLEALAEKGYEIEIQMHPRLWQQRFDFTESEHVKIESDKKDVEEETRETLLLLTDYSSVAFDYAFTDTPVIYAQFDKEAFYSHHAYARGYFDFERDGFGPVCYNFESTVETLVRLIENDCRMDEEYQRRINEFFAYRDGKNCERIYQELLRQK